MTDKEKIRATVEKRMLFLQYQPHKNNVVVELKGLLSFIDSLQEEPVSEELEEEKTRLFGDCKVRRGAFELGAKWQKKQIMKDAIDAKCFGFQGAALFSFRLPADNYLVGSKVKVVVIKED